MVDAEVFEPFPDAVPFNSVGGAYAPLLNLQPPVIGSYISSARFQDIGTPADYLRTSLDLSIASGHDSLTPGEGSIIAPSARVSGTAIWNDVIVEEDAELLNCVVADGVRIPAGMRLESSAVVRAADVEPSAHERQVGDLLIAPISAATQR